MRLARLGLAFVISPLLACPGDDEGETAASTASSTGEASTSTATTTGEPETTTGSGGAMTTTGSSGLPGDDSSSGGGANPVDACTASCEHLVKCDVEDLPNCGIPCSGLDAMIAGCESEYLAQQACVVALSCEDLQVWADAMMVGSEHPCAAEDGAFQDCLGTGTSTG